MARRRFCCPTPSPSDLCRLVRHSRRYRINHTALINTFLAFFKIRNFLDTCIWRQCAQSTINFTRQALQNKLFDIGSEPHPQIQQPLFNNLIQFARYLFCSTVVRGIQITRRTEQEFPAAGCWVREVHENTHFELVVERQPEERAVYEMLERHCHRYCYPVLNTYGFVACGNSLQRYISGRYDSHIQTNLKRGTLLYAM